MIGQEVIVCVQLINLMIRSMFYAKIVFNIALYVQITKIANNVILIEFLMGLNVVVNKGFMRVLESALNVPRIAWIVIPHNVNNVLN